MPRLKKKENRMGDYIPSQEERDAQVWCINNQIRIWPTESKYQSNEWYAEIQIARGKINRSPEVYTKGDIWGTIYGYYLYYYNKREQ